MTQKPPVLLAGCGYTGRRVATMLLADGYPVTGLVRSQRSLESAQARGIRTLRSDLGAFTHPELAGAAVVVYLAQPPPSGERDTTLEGFVGALDAPPQRFVYVSTSGVYGDCAGALVDESRAVNPTTGRAVRRIAAETALREYCEERDIPWVILRAPGIYGPGRMPLVRLRRREPVLRETDAAPGNRIHVDDLARACCTAVVTDCHRRIYNVSDGNYLSATAFQKRVAKIAGLPPPPEIPLAEARERFTPMRWSFLAESRRLDNTAMLQELGVVLRYADPDEGIRASLGTRPGLL